MYADVIRSRSAAGYNAADAWERVLDFPLVYEMQQRTKTALKGCSPFHDLEFGEEYESEDTDEPDESPYADFVY